ncbi:hypothetical protein NXX23_17710 [Bacteroides ovatus]|nr:hypothetical protein [Bacteroides ovatus]
MVKLSILDEHVILGAFKEIDAKGRVVLYCLLDEDGSLRYSLHETVGYAVNLQILPIGTSGTVAGFPMLYARKGLHGTDG